MVSVVVTAHNAAATIEDCLRSIAANREVQSGEAEILLVDDRSGDDTTARAAALELPCLRLLRIDRYRPGRLTARQAALDLGFGQARGTFILVTDADAEVPPDWISHSLRHLTVTGVDAAAGLVEFGGGSPVLAPLQTVDALYYLGVCRLLNAVGLAPGVLFGNFAFRKRAYEETGGFDAAGFAFTEDFAFARLLHAGGCRISFKQPSLVTVGGCRTWREWLARSRRINRAPPSALFYTIGLWMLLPVLLGLAALGGSPVILTALAIRCGLGVLFTAVAILRISRFRLLPLSFIYEPLAIALGAAVMLTWRRRTIRWGGITYDR